MKNKTCFLPFLVFLVIGVSLPAFAEEGVTDTEIHIGSFGPLTGPAAMWGTTVYGIETFFRLLNEKGGVHGRKIIFHPLDDGYNPAKTKAGVKRLQESVGIFAWVGGVGTAPCLSVFDYLTGRGIPWIAPATGSEKMIDPPRRNIFAFYPITSMEAAVLCRYAAGKMGKARIAMAYQNDPFGINGLKGASEELSRFNLNLVSAIPVEKNDSNMVKVANELRQSRADIVLLWLNTLSTLQVMQAARNMEFVPQWMAPVSFSDFSVVHTMSRGLIEGLIVDSYADLNSPSLPKYLDAHERLGRPGVECTAYYLAGMSFGELAAEGLKRCGRELTREKFMREMENIKGFQTFGPPVSYEAFDPADPQCRNGVKDLFLMQCLENGKAKVLTDWISIQMN